MKAEECFHKQMQLRHEATVQDKILLGALKLQRENFKAAKLYFDEVLDADWTHSHANLLFGIFYKLIEWPEMSRKHFAIAKVKRMRDLGILPPKSNVPKNFRTQAKEYRVEVIDYKKVKTTDEKLSPKENDLMFFDLIDFLLDRCVFGVADLALEYIQDKSTQRYLMAEAKVRISQKRYQDATNSLKKLLSNNPNDQQAWILRGHAFFFLNNLFDSEECYINALRIKPTPDDATLNIRLGLIYARRKSWKDAKTVFLKICK